MKSFKATSFAIKFLFWVILISLAIFYFLPVDEFGLKCGRESPIPYIILLLAILLPLMVAIIERLKKKISNSMFGAILLILLFFLLTLIIILNQGCSRCGYSWWVTRSDMNQLKFAQEMFYEKNNRYADTQEELIADVKIFNEKLKNRTTGEEFTDKDGKGIEGGDNNPETWAAVSYIRYKKLNKWCRMVSEEYMYICDQDGCYEEVVEEIELPETKAQIQSLEIIPSQQSEEGIIYQEGAKIVVIGKKLSKVEFRQRGGGQIYISPEGGLMGTGIKTEAKDGEEKWESSLLPIERFLNELCAIGFDSEDNKVGEVCLFNVYGQALVESETVNWKVYRNEEYRFELKNPKEFDYKVVSMPFSTDIAYLYFNWAKNNNKVQFRISINQIPHKYGTAHTVQVENANISKEVEVINIKIPENFTTEFTSYHLSLPEDEVWESVNSWDIYSRFCTDKNFIPKSDCETNPLDATKAQMENDFEFQMHCEGSEWGGIEGAEKCDKLYSQILSTFKFLE